MITTFRSNHSKTKPRRRKLKLIACVVFFFVLQVKIKFTIDTRRKKERNHFRSTILLSSTVTARELPAASGA
jgi:hypothetical protein